MLAPPRGVCSREPGALTCTAPTIDLLEGRTIESRNQWIISRTIGEGLQCQILFKILRQCRGHAARLHLIVLLAEVPHQFRIFDLPRPDLEPKTALVLVLVQVQVLVLVLFCVLVLVLVLVLGWFCCWLLGWFCCWLLVRLLFTPLRASERPLNIL